MFEFVVFTSLIVQIKLKKFIQDKKILYSVYIPHSSDKTKNNGKDSFTVYSSLHPS